MIRQGPRKPVDAQHWRGRLSEARVFLEAARNGLILLEEGKSASPAVSSMVLAMIAYGDAITARKALVVNQRDHTRLPTLIREVLGNALSDAQLRRFRRLIDRKDEVQYGIRGTTRETAQSLLQDLEVFAQFAEEQLL